MPKDPHPYAIENPYCLCKDIFAWHITCYACVKSTVSRSVCRANGSSIWMRVTVKEGNALLWLTVAFILD